MLTRRNSKTWRPTYSQPSAAGRARSVGSRRNAPSKNPSPPGCGCAPTRSSRVGVRSTVLTGSARTRPGCAIGPRVRRRGPARCARSLLVQGRLTRLSVLLGQLAVVCREHDRGGGKLSNLIIPRSASSTEPIRWSSAAHYKSFERYYDWWSAGCRRGVATRS